MAFHQGESSLGTDGTSFDGLSLLDIRVALCFTLCCKPHTWQRWLAAGTAMSVAELCTIPVDTAKVRLQLQGQTKLAPGQVPYTSMTNCLLRMAREEGPTSLFKGLKPGILRQMVYGGLRLGMYDNVRDFYALKIDGTSDGMGLQLQHIFTTPRSHPHTILTSCRSP